MMEPKVQVDYETSVDKKILGFVLLTCLSNTINPLAQSSNTRWHLETVRF